MTTHLTRREAMTAAGLAAAGLLLPHRALAAARPALFTPGAPTRLLRLAHMTDIHVMPEKRAGEGLAACLAHVHSLKDKPSLILTGGDSVMDSFEADLARTNTQWDVWKKTFKANCTLPVESAVGNHDVWGWNKKNSKTTGTEPLYGKLMAEEMLGAKRYRSFDRAGWHFVVLDSVFPAGDGYLGKLDEEQFEWLKGDLAANPKSPTLILSHIPIVSVTAYFFSQKYKDGNHQVPGAWLHEDTYRLTALFSKNKQVKVCLSGHMHMVDRCDYNDVTYYCNGAVCGNWWKGRHKECDEGYATLDLFDDGSSVREYHTYGWKAEAPPPTPAR